MLDWNMPEIPKREGLTHQEIQDLVAATYVEEQDKWKNDVLKIETEIVEKNKEIQRLKAGKDKWWEMVYKIFRRKTQRQKTIETLATEIMTLGIRYGQRLGEPPRPEAYELAMLGGTIFKAK